VKGYRQKHGNVGEKPYAIAAVVYRVFSLTRRISRIVIDNPPFRDRPKRCATTNTIRNESVQENGVYGGGRRARRQTNESQSRDTLSSPVFDPEYLGEKIRNVFETVRIGDRIDDHETVAFSHVLLSHRTEFLLTGRVQNLKRKNNDQKQKNK